MATYIHHYYCKCQCVGQLQPTEKSDSEKPRYIGKHHFELDRASCCQRYLRYLRTEPISGSGANTKKPERNTIDFGIQTLNIYKTSGVNAATVAVMWDPYTEQWYNGHSNHDIKAAKTEVPSDISTLIAKQTIDQKDWAFGWNCAEVGCLIKAFQNGKIIHVKEKHRWLEGCYFIAWNIPNQQYYGACKTCKNWIKEFGGEYYSPQDKTIQDTTLRKFGVGKSSTNLDKSEETTTTGFSNNNNNSGNNHRFNNPDHKATHKGSMEGHNG